MKHLKLFFLLIIVSLKLVASAEASHLIDNNLSAKKLYFSGVSHNAQSVLGDERLNESEEDEKDPHRDEIQGLEPVFFQSSFLSFVLLKQNHIPIPGNSSRCHSGKQLFMLYKNFRI